MAELLAIEGPEQIGAVMTELQHTMMEHVSVFRHAKGLQAALANIRELKERCTRIAILDKGKCFNRNLLDSIELGQMLDMAEVITLGALYRRESRGAHWREDFPKRDDEKFLTPP